LSRADLPRLRTTPKEDIVDIENIEEMRLREGIDDVELREEIRRLRVGDQVHLTFLGGAKPAGETRLVRITSIRDGRFRGKLVSKLVSVGLPVVPAGAPVVFTASHIHSVAKKHPGHDD
jgi:hypothetical protein